MPAKTIMRVGCTAFLGGVQGAGGGLNVQSFYWTSIFILCWLSIKGERGTVTRILYTLRCGLRDGAPGIYFHGGGLSGQYRV